MEKKKSGFLKSVLMWLGISAEIWFAGVLILACFGFYLSLKTYLIMLAVILTVTGFFWLCLYAILGDLSVDNTNCNVGTGGASSGTYYSNDCSDSDSSSNDSYSSGSSSYDRYNGPKTLPPPGAYDVLFDIDNDGQMSAEEVYLQTKNREHMENDTSNGFWW